MADIRIINEWLEKADDDFHFAAANLREGSEFFAQICFHFQQSAEKYLKAYIIAHDLAFSKVHDLVYLLKICSDNMPELGLLKEDCIFLNAAYIDTRYPVHWPTDYTRETALKLYTSADNIAQTIRKKLGLKLVGGQ